MLARLTMMSFHLSRLGDTAAGQPNLFYFTFAFPSRNRYSGNISKTLHYSKSLI
jgi:hypothetical protein